MTKETPLPTKSRKSAPPAAPDAPKEKKPKLSKKQRIEEKRRFKIEKLKESKVDVEHNLTAAQSSTKSVGRFDKKAHEEEREHKVKRRKEYSNFSKIED